MYSNARVPFAPLQMNQHSNYPNQYAPQQGYAPNNLMNNSVMAPSPNTFSTPNPNFFAPPSNNISNNNNIENQSNLSNLSQSKEEFSYTPFESLPNFPSNINLGKVVEQIGLCFADQKNFRNQFDSIQNLRIFNKFYPTEVNGMFEQFGMNIVDAIEGVKPCTVKSAIMLLREVFVTARTTKINDTVIFKFVPVLHLKALNTAQFINTEAQLALSELSTSCSQMDSAYQVSCQLCFDKNPQVCENSMKLLANLIQNGAEHFMKLDPNTLQGLMKTLTKLMDGKRQNMKNWALQVCQFIGNLIGEENYMNLIQNVLTKEECVLMVSNIQQHGQKESKIQQPSFQDFRLKRQTEIQASQNMSQNFYPNNNYMGVAPPAPQYFENNSNNNFINNSIAPVPNFGGYVGGGGSGMFN